MEMAKHIDGMTERKLAGELNTAMLAAKQMEPVREERCVITDLKEDNAALRAQVEGLKELYAGSHRAVLLIDQELGDAKARATRAEDRVEKLERVRRAFTDKHHPHCRAVDAFSAGASCNCGLQAERNAALAECGEVK